MAPAAAARRSGGRRGRARHDVELASQLVAVALEVVSGLPLDAPRALRSLQRRVHDEGTSLRALIDEARLAGARELLGDDRLSIDEVAFLLGYSELRSFTRAFKRWTGVTPARFRRERR
ncbi:MAG: helix-turn-helix transcriptional regulator [Myxococcales bacterium]|nr:helix-turn-helix transcriptional regulator [Myxococcales bacterium]